MRGHADRETINQRKPLTPGMVSLLRAMAKSGGHCIGCDQSAASRARGLMDRGYATPPENRGGRWHATEAGIAALAKIEAQ